MKVPPILWSQYLVCPPLAFITALILLCMEFTSALIFLIGMFSHSSSNVVRNCPRVLGVFRRLLTRLSSSSHKCSLGDKSGLYSVQSSGTMLLFARKSWQTLATWGRTLSCWKVIWCCCINGTASGRRISSLYLTAVRFPGTTINGDFTPWEIPPHTVTDPPPYLSLSKTQALANRSPQSRYKRRRPSAWKRVNRDSSVKKTRLHCLIGKRLGACAVEGFFLLNVEYQVKIVEYRVKLVEYRVKIVEYRVNFVEYRVNLVEYQVKLVEYGVKIVEYRVKIVEYRVKLVEYRVNFVKYRVNLVEYRVNLVEYRVKIIYPWALVSIVAHVPLVFSWGKHLFKWNASWPLFLRNSFFLHWTLLSVLSLKFHFFHTMKK